MDVTTSAGAAPSCPPFGAWAEAYQRYRPAYPDAAFARLEQLLGGRQGVCVEIGAGSGQATAALLERFDQVIAIEPDARMAERLPRLPGLSVLNLSAEAAPIRAGCADAIVAATALHWLDAERALPRIASWLRPGGVFYAFAYRPALFPAGPAGLEAAVMSYTRLWNAHLPEKLLAWRPYAQLLEASGAFEAVGGSDASADFHWSADALAGFLLSTSYGRAFAQASGDEQGCHEELREALRRAGGDRPIAVRLPLEIAYGRTAGVSA